MKQLKKKLLRRFHNVSIGTDGQSEGSILMARPTAAWIMFMSTLLGLGQSESFIIFTDYAAVNNMPHLPQLGV